MSFVNALPSLPPLFKSSFMSLRAFFRPFCEVILIEKLGKHLRGTSRGARDSRTQYARGDGGWVARLCSAPCTGPDNRKVCCAGVYRRTGGS